MTVIGLKPVMMKDAVFTVAGDDYTAALTQVLFVPQVEWMWLDGIGQSHPEPVFVRVRWVVQVGFLQDYSAANSLASFLILNAAQRRTVTFAPQTGGSSIAADVMLIPASVGGVPGQQMSADATLPCFEEPVLTLVSA